jgi:mannose-6-phosphate isomerase
MIPYPIKFTPILMHRIWGGQKLKTVFNKDSNLDTVGESWELSDVDNHISIVANGPLKGKSLRELIQTYGADLMGAELLDRFGDRFPLLIKFIDAKQDLSIQVHPDNALAMERHQSFGKTEMWYIMQADEGARLVLGFKEQLDAESYLMHLENKTIASAMHFEKVRKGDAFFIETGTVHAIGAGIVLAEIQQTSDITYRIYDWDRKDKDGNERELHTELAVDALNFDTGTDSKRSYSEEVNRSNTIVDCSYFKTSLMPVAHTMEKDLSALDAFVIYMCVEGEGSLEIDGFTASITTGETLLVPACASQLKLESSGSMKLLEVTVP